VIPRISPPTTTPMPLDNPPMMATANALSPSAPPIAAPVEVTGAISTPAKAAASEESA